MLGGSIYDWKILEVATFQGPLWPRNLWVKIPALKFSMAVQRLGAGALGFCGLLHAAAASAASGQPEWSPKTP